MRIQGINNNTFKAFVCNDYTRGEHKENYWHKFVADCRNIGKDKDLDELLWQMNKNGSRDVLAIEEVLPNSHNGDKKFITIALYNNEDDVVRDRRKNPKAKPKYSINENGIILELGEYEKYNTTVAISEKSSRVFNTLTDAIFYTLKQYLNNDSWMHEQLTSNRLVEPKNYLQRFAKKFR